MTTQTACTHTYILTDVDQGIHQDTWQTTGPGFTITQKVLHGGKQEGSKVISICSPDGLTIHLSPTRGMGILSAEGKGIRLGWDSPVKEVVNPAFINLDSRNGLGWLDGFNELVARCGYEWTGHASTVNGRLYSLHGRAQNTPASYVAIDIEDQPPYTIHVRGLIKESTFKNTDLHTMTELIYVPGTTAFTLRDVLTNHADYTQDYQIIYHNNFGTPILEQGAKVLAAASEISPYDEYAATGLTTWQTYLGPTKDFNEMVYHLKPLADAQGKSLAALINKAGDKGVSIEFDTQQLPLLNLWKNTDTLKQGYVTGIEPSTNHAYPISIEREQNRIRQLQPGQSTTFDLTFTLLDNASTVKQAETRIQQIQGATTLKLLTTPIAKIKSTA